MPWATLASALPSIAGAASKGGLLGGGGGGSKTTSQSTSNTTVSVNPAISVVSGPGSVSPYTSGSASGSASSSTPAGVDGVQGYGYGDGSLPFNTYDDIDATPISDGLGLDGLLADPMMLALFAGGGLLLFMATQGKGA